ncbi:hypothetical protein [Actinoplanes sp. NPDC051494]|uniref:hypothetical protein n=1 Tax=Actinoplanes sp. NPDC051494 TaxID=3363907 RepID=UPI0037BA062D
MVVFDCNIYLDAARILGEPFGWDKLWRVVDDLMSVPVPHPRDEAFDSLRALRAAYAGKRGDDVQEVWTSRHIDDMVQGVAGRPLPSGKAMGDSGLGWQAESAEDLIEDLILDLVDRTHGGVVDRNYPDGNPPLDHEDGMVFGACRALAGQGGKDLR